jgi:hypothetical protein
MYLKKGKEKLFWNLFGEKEAVKEQQCDDDENDDKTLVHLLPLFFVAGRMYEWNENSLSVKSK